MLVYTYELTFYDSGFDFRPGRSAYDVVIHSKNYMEKGCIRP